MRRTKMISALLLALVVGIGFSANVAQAKKHHGKKHGGNGWMQKEYQRMHEKLFANITLTADQETKVKADFDTWAQSMRDFHKQHATDIKSLREQMKEAHKNGDKAKMKDLRKQLHDLMVQAPKMKDAIGKMRTELTPDQQTQFDKNVAAMHGGKHGKHGKHAKKHKKDNNS